MNAGTAGKLYTPQLLSLATELAQYPLGDRKWGQFAQSRSRTCGSTIALGIDHDDAGRVEKLGMRVSACAVGQASAAIFARALEGVDAATIVEIRGGMDAWLNGNGAAPQWPDIELLEPALEHSARHAAILLPWNAAVEALSLRTGSS